jgi:hypothetical protein
MGDGIFMDIMVSLCSLLPAFSRFYLLCNEKIGTSDSELRPRFYTGSQSGHSIPMSAGPEAGSPEG